MPSRPSSKASVVAPRGRDYLVRILNARVYDLAEQTPLDAADNLSRRLRNRVLLKREDLQPVFSFKLRGASNKLLSMTPAQRRRGVICASAGNDAQGVAMAAAHLGVRARVVMPTTTPEIKVQAVRHLGAQVVLEGDNYDAAQRHARELQRAEGLGFVHPYDDPDVIAGQGTIAAELLRQCEEPIEAVFVPVGGGGLIGGMAAYIKQLRPQVRVIGVECEDSAAMHAALQAGQRVRLRQIGLFADGTAVRRVGAETFRLAQAYVDEILVVSIDAVCAAIKDLFEDTRAMMEPAGALGVAGMKAWVAKRRCHGRRLVAVTSGANVNFDRLRYVAERAEIGECREVILAARIPERPGSFRGFARALGRHAISEFNYRYSGPDAAHVFVGLRLNGDLRRKQRLIERLRRHGYSIEDLSDSETAKLHIRHLVGGRVAGLGDDCLLYTSPSPRD